MHHIQFRLGLRPRPRWGSLQCSPDPLPGLRGLLLMGGGRGGQGKGRGVEGREMEGRGRKGEGGVQEGRGRDPTPLRPSNPYFGIRPCYHATE